MGHVYGAAVAAADGVTTDNAQSWITGNIIPLAILVIAAVMLFLSRSGQVAKIMTMGACVLIALGVAGLAVDGANPAKKVGSWMVGMFVDTGDADSPTPAPGPASTPGN